MLSFLIQKKINALERILQGSIDIEDFNNLNDDWNIKERIRKSIEIFSLKIENLSTKISELSNGQITQLNLAKIFYFDDKKDLTLLDEPTNNLDITAREILYDTVEKWDKGLLVISHDQKLLEQMDRILAITENGINSYGGNFSFYKTKLKKNQDAKIRNLKDAEKTLRKTHKVTQKNNEKHEKTTKKGVKSRQKNDQPKSMLDWFQNRSQKTQQTLKKQKERLLLNAQENLQKAKNNLEPEYNIKVNLPKTFVPQNKIITSIKNLNFCYTKKEPYLINNFNLKIIGPEKIAICGANGSGKSTLLKLIQKRIKPDIGTIETNVKSHYLDQQLEILDPNLSLLENYKKLNPNVTENEAHKNLASFLFRNKKVLQKTGDLSYGEKIRLALACILLSNEPPKLLLLDEPTT